jgi:hypothetical protein
VAPSANPNQAAPLIPLIALKSYQEKSKTQRNNKSKFSEKSCNKSFKKPEKTTKAI